MESTSGSTHQLQVIMMKTLDSRQNSRLRAAAGRAFEGEMERIQPSQEGSHLKESTNGGRQQRRAPRAGGGRSLCSPS